MNIYTLGPSGTNCEKAATQYMEKQHWGGQIELRKTLEDALDDLLSSSKPGVLMGCIVYPQLHEIVFRHLDRLQLVDHHLMNTHDMVFANNQSQTINRIGSHPAPTSLLSQVDDFGISAELVLCTSNSEAALQCAQGSIDACITTIVAARANNLHIAKNFGPVPMGFSIHLKI
ncbi:type 2 periplasmic-binding domain-containing protein [Pseudomonas costantinii]|uniref:Prephenate dehydratase n=1 Tax=Pseudomonas costantinii TaxID=168469 RepID=A0A1S2UGW0_9PSED|nr:hypothetical protein [Pseudomonas costantinii]NVZ18496.1 hypothetical protein [Pseudomonas costantinii]OIN45410.1 hypothetical protein BFL40_28215 [Pseudomonas costantinii]SED40273.1 hypothetical protein SAMN04515675_1000 [Pseudomonas costantinii]